MQKRIEICKTILSTRLLQQRYCMLSSIAAPVPHKGNKEEAEIMNAPHGQTLHDKASSSIAHLSLSMQGNTDHTTSSTTLFHAIFDCCSGATQSKIEKKLKTWTCIMVKHYTSNFQLDRSSLASNAKADCDMQSNTCHTTSSTTLVHAIFDCCSSAEQRK